MDIERKRDRDKENEGMGKYRKTGEVKRLKKMIGDDVIWKLQDDGMKEDEFRR